MMDRSAINSSSSVGSSGSSSSVDIVASSSNQFCALGRAPPRTAFPLGGGILMLLSPSFRGFPLLGVGPSLPCLFTFDFCDGLLLLLLFPPCFLLPSRPLCPPRPSLFPLLSAAARRSAGESKLFIFFCLLLAFFNCLTLVRASTPRIRD